LLLLSACCCRATSAARFSSAMASKFFSAVFEDEVVVDDSRTSWNRLYWIDLRVGGAVGGFGEVGADFTGAEGAGWAGFLGGGSWLLPPSPRLFLEDIILCDASLEEEDELDLVLPFILLRDFDLEVSDDAPFPFDSLLLLPFLDFVLSLLLVLCLEGYVGDELLGSSIWIAGDVVSSGVGDDEDDDLEECAMSPRSLPRNTCCCLC
jgi:hypothetical protein